MRNSAGYTLVELLTVVSVFGVLAVTSSQLFFSSVVGSSKEATLREVKQSGDYAVVQLENVLRNAKSVPGCSTTPTQMSEISFETLGGEEQAISLSNQDYPEAGKSKLLLNGEELLSGNIFIKENSMNLSCTTDPDTGVTHVSLSFELQKGKEGTEKPEEIFSDVFSASVTLRNRF